MLKVIRSRNELTVTKKLGTSEPFKNKHTHQDISKSIMDRGFDCASVLIQREPLDEKISQDPKHCKVTRTIHNSEFEDIVRKEAERHYPELDVIFGIMKSKFPDRVTNQENGNAVCHKQYRNELEKKIWKAYDLMHFAKIFWDMRMAVESDIREETPEMPLSERQKRVWDDLFDMMLPQVYTDREQIFPLPEPFNYWSDKNSWQQWYLVDKGDRIDYAVGGSGTSYFREQHGKYGHTFSSLSQRGYEIPTYIFTVTQFNELKFVKAYDCFKVARYELYGNYRVDWDKTKTLFKNRLLSLSKGAFQEVSI
jgi:hypothetical protein